VEKNEIVAMDFVNSEKFVWVWFGLWSIGAKPAFINYNLTGKPLVHTIKTSTARLVLVDEDSRDNFRPEVLQEHGFVPLGDQKYGFETDHSDITHSVSNHTSTPQPIEPGRVQRQIEIIYFDSALQTHILTFTPTRLPNTARANQKQSDMAMLIYTSGTTGLPKPAVLSWGKVNPGSGYVASWLKLTSKDVFYTAMPLYHASASMFGVCTTLRTGCTLSLSKRFSHKTFWPEIRSSKATILQYVGETCRYLLSAPPSPLDKTHNLRGAFGNGLRPDVWEPFKQRFGITTIFEFYGATEGPGGIWNTSSNDFSTGAIAQNGTIAGVLFTAGIAVIRLEPDTSVPQPVRNPKTGLCIMCDWDEPGEILFKLDASNISRKYQGYFNNASASSSKIIRDVRVKGDAYFRSGDLIKRDKQGRWWFVDRIGDTFRWKAENVSTAEVSEALGKHPAVAEANVYGVQVPGHDGRAGCAAVVLRPNFTVKSSTASSGEVHVDVPTQATLQSLAEYVTKELPTYARPVWIRITKEMQTTGTNKQQKHILQKEGIDVETVEEKGDVLFWLREGRYERFTTRDLKSIQGGGVKL
jgi:acyl-CoA synthetase (AMP-forming)/AMP-acid ligase II